MKKIIFVGALIILMETTGFCQMDLSRDRTLDVIDIPTAEVLNHYGYQVSFRFAKEGALQNKSIFGIFPRLNLGFGLDGENIIGTGKSDINKPTLNVKFRFFDGKGILPAFAAGFDGQGYRYNDKRKKYDHREKGFYLVASKDIVSPDFMVHAGVSKFDFDESDTTRGFVGANYTYERLLGLMLEYDHATKRKESRLNYGLKYYVTPLFTIDAIGRNTPKHYGSSSRETERVVRLTYKGTF